jgi:hypothetical protein
MQVACLRALKMKKLKLCYLHLPGPGIDCYHGGQWQWEAAVIPRTRQTGPDTGCLVNPWSFASEGIVAAEA